MNSPSRGTDRPSSTSTPSARPPPKSSPPELMSPSTATQLVRAVPRPRSCTREGRHRGVRRRLCVVEEDALVAEPRVRGADQRSLRAAQCSRSTPRSTASSLQSTRSRLCLLSCVPLRWGRGSLWREPRDRSLRRRSAGLADPGRSSFCRSPSRTVRSSPRWWARRESRACGRSSRRRPLHEAEEPTCNKALDRCRLIVCLIESGLQ